MLAAVAVGLAPAVSQPALALGLVAVLLASAIAARLRFAHAAAAVLLLSCISYGLVRMSTPSLASAPFWLAAFVGLAIGGSPWTTWRAPSPWRVPIAWWATSVAVSWPIVAGRETGLAFDNPAVTGVTVSAALVQMTCAVWLDTVLGAARGAGDSEHHLANADRLRADSNRRDAGTERRDFAGPSDVKGSPGVADRTERRGFSPGVRWPLAASAVITALAAIYQRFVDIAWLSGDPWIRLGRATGLMGDANPMGVVTALWAPLVLAALLWTGTAATTPGAEGSAYQRFVGRHGLRIAAGWALALVLWTAAWASGARSTLILFAAGALGLGLGWTIRRGRRGRQVALGLAAAGVVIAVALVLAVPRMPPSSPLGRLAATVPSGSAGAAFYELLWRRDGYGLAAIEAIRERPLNGIGIGQFPRRAPEYYARVERRAIPPDNAQSLWRHTLAERGLLGTLPIAWLTVLTMRALVRRTSDPRRAVMHAVVAGLGVVLAFGYPVQDPAVAVTLATLVGLTAFVGTRDPAADRSKAAPPRLWALAIAAVAVGAVLDVFG